MLLLLALSLAVATSNAQVITADLINAYCPIWNGVCGYSNSTSANFYFANATVCQSFMATVDESGLLCRLYHLTLARTAPIPHCTHAAEQLNLCPVTSATAPTAAQLCSGYAADCTIANGVSFQTTLSCEIWYNSTSTNLPKIFAFMNVAGSMMGQGYCQAGSMTGLVSTYCSTFNTVCGYATTANYYTSATSCMMFFVGMEVPSFLCRYYHLTFAARNSSLQATHCPHAGMLSAPCPKTGATQPAYCNTPVALGDSGGGFSNGYCNYGGTGQFASQTACSTAYAAMNSATKICVAYHLTLSTQGNAFVHCQHASGRAPCGSMATLTMPPTSAPSAATTSESARTLWSASCLAVVGLLNVLFW